MIHHAAAKTVPAPGLQRKICKHMLSSRTGIGLCNAIQGPKGYTHLAGHGNEATNARAYTILTSTRHGENKWTAIVATVSMPCSAECEAAPLSGSHFEAKGHLSSLLFFFCLRALTPPSTPPPPPNRFQSSPSFLCSYRRKSAKRFTETLRERLLNKVKRRMAAKCAVVVHYFIPIPDQHFSRAESRGHTC